MNELNPNYGVKIADKAEVFITLYVKDENMLGDYYSSLSTARKGHTRGPGMILHIQRTEQGDFITSVAEEF